jgi:hypothetical protein
MSAARTNRKARHAVILILSYDGQTEEMSEKLRKDAQNIQTKLESSGDTVTPCPNEKDMVDFFKTDKALEVEKIHIVAHGNWEQCGRFNAAPLADWLAPMICEKAKGRNVKKITLHSCFSGSKHSGTNETKTNETNETKTNEANETKTNETNETKTNETNETDQIFVLQVASGLATQIGSSRYVEVRGSDGLSATDGSGHNWVLPKDTKIEPQNNKEREAQWFKNHAKDRGTARPRFAAQGFSGKSISLD